MGGRVIPKNPPRISGNPQAHSDTFSVSNTPVQLFWHGCHQNRGAGDCIGAGRARCPPRTRGSHHPPRWSPSFPGRGFKQTESSFKQTEWKIFHPFPPLFHLIFHPLSIFTMSRTTHSVETMEAMGDAQWDLIACNTFPGLTAAQHSEVVARWRRDKPWGGKFRRCGNKGCAVVLGPAHHTSRCCRVPKGGRGSGTTPIDMHIANQKAVDKDEVKIIGHLNDRYGAVVKGPNVPLSYWNRIEAASKLLWTGMLQRAPPIEVEVPGGTLPAYT